LQLAFGVALLIGAALLQATALSGPAGSPRPDLVLLMVLAWSINRGLAEGAIAGILGGLALDTLSAAPFGLHTGLLGAIGSLTALGEENLFRGSLALFALTAALATVVLHAGSLLLLQASGQQALSFARFVQFVVPVAVLNAVLMPLAYTLVRRGVRALAGWRQLEL
jgi:rod shape-determining protein MreD